MKPGWRINRTKLLDSRDIQLLLKSGAMHVFDQLSPESAETGTVLKSNIKKL